MTGGTRFTRKAGAMGTLSGLLVLLMLPVTVHVSTRPGFYEVARTGVLDVLAPVASLVWFVCSVTCLVGLGRRHRGEGWVWAVVVLLVLSVALPLRREGTDALLGAAVALLGLGAARSRMLPRPGGVALAAGALAMLVAPTDPALLAAAHVAMAGLAALGWAMWHEPIVDRRAAAAKPTAPSGVNAY